MSDVTVRLFIDTNAFIQLRDLDSLPWRDLFPRAARIDILVSQTVIDELDRLKSGTNERRRNRARRALKLINMASKNLGFSLSLQHKTVTLQLIIANGTRPDWSALSILDPSRPDDRLVADALSFGDGAAIFSHDTGPCVRARIMGIEAFEPPETESWLLPEERTDDQRKIALLERQLADAMSAFPRIIAELGSLDSPKERVEFIIPILPPLPSALQAQLVAAYLDRHPRRRLPPDSYARNFLVSYLHGDTAESFNRKLDKFESEVDTYFSQFHQTVAARGRACPVCYVVKNDSGVAARGLRVEAHVEGEVMVFADGEDANSLFGAMSLPKLPVFDRGLAPLPLLETITEINRPRDPTGFYWYERPRGGEPRSALQCDDFRAARIWESDLWLSPAGKLPLTSAVRLDISATNLPAPITRSAEIVMEEKRVDWSDDIVVELVPEEIRPLFEASL